MLRNGGDNPLGVFGMIFCFGGARPTHRSRHRRARQAPAPKATTPAQALPTLTPGQTTPRTILKPRPHWSQNNHRRRAKTAFHRPTVERIPRLIENGKTYGTLAKLMERWHNLWNAGKTYGTLAKLMERWQNLWNAGKTYLLQYRE